MNTSVVRLIAFFFLLGYSLLASAEEHPPSEYFVKAHFLNESGESVTEIEAQVSEKIAVLVDIYSSTWFSKAPVVFPFSIDDAIVVRTEKFATNFVEKVNGQSFSVQRWEYNVFPQRDGQFVVPSTTIKLRDAVAGKDLQLQSNPLIFWADKLPASPFKNLTTSRVLSADSLDMQERYSAEQEEFKTGDVLVREVIVRAEGALSILIPPLFWEDVAGVRQQSNLSRVQDTDSRGRLQGERIETRHYIFEKKGSYVLPELNLVWWDANTKMWRENHLPSRMLRVKQGALHAGDTRRENSAQWLVSFKKKLISSWPYVLGLLTVVLLFIAAYTLFLKLKKLWLTHKASERGRYAYLKRTILQGKPKDIMKALDNWQACYREPLPWTPELDRILSDLFTQAIASDKGVRLNNDNRQRLLHILEDVRVQRLATTVSQQTNDLMPLNPS